MELQLPRPKLQNIYTVVVRDAENKEELARYEMHNTAYNKNAFYYSYWMSINSSGSSGFKLYITNTDGNRYDGNIFNMDNKTEIIHLLHR